MAMPAILCREIPQHVPATIFVPFASGSLSELVGTVAESPRAAVGGGGRA